MLFNNNKSFGYVVVFRCCAVAVSRSSAAKHWQQNEALYIEKEL